MLPFAPWPLLVCTRRSAGAGRRPRHPVALRNEKSSGASARSFVPDPGSSFVHLRRLLLSQCFDLGAQAHVDDRRSSACPQSTGCLSPTQIAPLPSVQECAPIVRTRPDRTLLT